MKFTLKGQMPSGKNAVIVTRTGKRFPGKRFKMWRDDAARQIYMQLGTHIEPLTHKPLAMMVVYTPGDLRTRDVSGLIDALFSILGYCGIVEDDGQIRFVTWGERPLDRDRPGVTVELSEA